MERRAFFADKNWTKYKKAIQVATEDKQARMVRFTRHMLSSLNLENQVYVRSTEMCPDHIIRQAHERAILKAYTDWYALA